MIAREILDELEERRSTARRRDERQAPTTDSEDARETFACFDQALHEHDLARVDLDANIEHPRIASPCSVRVGALTHPLCRALARDRDVRSGHVTGKGLVRRAGRRHDARTFSEVTPEIQGLTRRSSDPVIAAPMLFCADRDEETDPKDDDDPLGIEPESDDPEHPEDQEIGPDAASRKIVDEPLGPADDVDFELDTDDARGVDDGASDDLDIGGIELAIDDSDRARPYGDAAGIEVEDDEFVPAFEEGPQVATEEPFLEPHADDGDDAPPWTADDGGAEGIGDGSEAQIDESDLPAMDADAAGDFELTDLLEEMGFGGDEPWEIVPALSHDDALACVTARDGTIVVAGSAVVIVERGGASPRVRPLADVAHGCALVDDTVLLATRRGIERVDASSLGPPRVVWARADVAQLAVAAAQPWVLAGSSLARLDLPSGACDIVKNGVFAIAAAQGTLFVASAGRIERIRGQDGGFEALEIDDAAQGFLDHDTVIGACSSTGLVLMNGGRAMLVHASGASTLLSRPGVVAATFRGDGDAARALLLCTSTRGLEMVTVDTSGTARGVVDIESSTAEARPAEPHALVWDPTREVVFVAGPAGLVCLRPRTKH